MHYTLLTMMYSSSMAVKLIGMFCSLIFHTSVNFLDSIDNFTRLIDK